MKESFTYHDQHMHSEYSADSKEKITNYLELAVQNHCQYFVTTEHLDMNINNSGVDWHADYKGLKEYLDSIQKDYPSLELLLGIEVGYKIDYLEYNKDVVKSCPFDLVNLSVHDYLDVDFYFYDNYEKHGVDNVMHLFFKKELEAIELVDDFDVLSHIDYAFKTIYMVNNTRRINEFEEDLKKVFIALVKKDKVLEINTKVQESINDDAHLDYLLELYKSCGGTLLTLSSDAHVANRYLSSFDRYKKIIRRHGFKNLCYFVKRKRYYYSIEEEDV